MFRDFVPAPNIGRNPDLYRLENQALARDGCLDQAIAALAPYAGLDLLDLGCGTGFWLSRFPGARSVIGVEPDPALRALAPDGVRAGSAEHIPLPDASVDVVQARFAYFFGPGAEAGLAEVRRVLRPGGTFVAVDNSWRGGHFAELLREAHTGNAAMDPEAAASWWAAQGAERHEVAGGWLAQDAQELERLLRLEFPGPVVDAFVARHPGLVHLSYRFAVYTWRP